MKTPFYTSKRVFWALVIAFGMTGIFDPRKAGLNSYTMYKMGELFLVAIVGMYLQFALTENEEKAEKDKTIKICPTCNKEFHSRKSSSVKYCSQECLDKKQP